MSKKTAEQEKPKPRTVGTVDVMGLKYQVIEEADGENVYAPTADRGGMIGRIFYDRELIYVYSDMSVRQKRQALAHELTHAWLNAVSPDGPIEDEYMCSLMEWMAFAIVREVDRLYPEREAKWSKDDAAKPEAA